jgi:flavin reductase (DIM6/NTAB) family NADH-FMN oxidoreductase RutF/rubredoxin
MNPKTLYKIPYGLYVVCSRKKDKINGQIANALFQVTSEPPTVAVSINRKNLTHEYIDYSKIFSASILCNNTPMEFIGTFGFKSGRDIDKFKDVNYKIGKTKSPVIFDNCLGYIEAKVINKLDVGTHTIFIGEIVDADVISDEKVMTYEYYHEIKGGKSPKNAPTYIGELKENKKMEDKKMDRYVCDVCGYVYDPEKGDPDNGISAGTKFEDLPENWVCPVCGAGKDSFSKE